MSIVRILVGACVLMAMSCGDDDGGGSPRPIYRSGVSIPGTTAGTGTGTGTGGTGTGASTSTGTGASTITVADLDESQLRQLCTTLDAHVQAQIGFDAIAYAVCLPAAIVLGGSPAGCQQQLDQCMSAFPEPIAVEAHLSDETVCFSDLRACEASVAALEGCVNVNLDLVYDILDNWTCGNAADQSGRAAAERAMDTVSVCADLSAGCNRFATVAVD